MPQGRADGRLLLLPGTPACRPIARLARALAWRGKELSGERLQNLVLPFGLRAVPARLSIALSRLDGAPCVLIDYRRTSWVAWWIRDEIREIEPGLWLGLVWCGRWRIGFFVLRFAEAEATG